MTKQNNMKKLPLTITGLLFVVSVLIAGTIPLGSCSDSKAQAKMELFEKTGEVFSQDNFLKWVDVGMVEWAELFIKAGADTNWKDTNGESLLAKICRSGKPQMVKLLLDNGACVNAKDKAGLAPLHWASFNLMHSMETSKLLIKAGANVNIRAETESTPLHAAISMAIKGW